MATEPHIIKFEAAHITALVDRDGVDAAERLKIMASLPGVAYSAELNGEIIACAGLVLMAPGQGYAWVTASNRVCQYRLWFHRQVRRYLAATIATMGIKLIHSEILKCSKRNREWIEVLGFKTRPYMIYELRM